MKAHRSSDASAETLTTDTVFRGGLGATIARPIGGLQVGGYAGAVYLYQPDEAFFEEASTAPSTGLLLEAGLEVSVPDLNSNNDDRWADAGPMLRLTVARQTYETNAMNGAAEFTTLGVFATLAWFVHLGADE